MTLAEKYAGNTFPLAFPRKCDRRQAQRVARDSLIFCLKQAQSGNAFHIQNIGGVGGTTYTLE
jgi:hypothetical protein